MLAILLICNVSQLNHCKLCFSQQIMFTKKKKQNKIDYQLYRCLGAIIDIMGRWPDFFTSVADFFPLIFYIVQYLTLEKS